MDSFKPRVRSGNMGDHVGEPVVLAGGFRLHENNTGTVTASDGGMVNVVFNGPAPTDATPFVEITGKVIDATTLEGWSAVNLGDKFDLNNYNEAITLMDKYPEPFAPAK